MSKPTKIKFYTKEGNPIPFKALKTRKKKSEQDTSDNWKSALDNETFPRIMRHLRIGEVVLANDLLKEFISKKIEKRIEEEQIKQDKLSYDDGWREGGENAKQETIKQIKEWAEKLSPGIKIITDGEAEAFDDYKKQILHFLNSIK